MQDFCIAQILSFSPLWSIWFESSKYWIWQLVVSKLHEGMNFQFWHQMLNEKILKKLYFHIILLWDLKILYILIYYTISQHCWPFCWKMLTFTFSNIQLPNIILFAWLNVKNIILGVVESTVLFKSKLFSKNEIFQKRHFLKKTFFSRLSRLINFDFLSMFLLWKCPLELVDNV